MIDEKFVILALLLNTFGDLKYVIATLRGHVRPNKVTWLFWAIAPLVAFSAEISEGVGWASVMTLSVGLNPLLVFAASFFNKKAEWKITKFDIICGFLSLVGIALWGITKDANLAIFFAILADLFAGIPTMTKAWYYPETENPSPFIYACFASVITLLTIKQWDFAHYGFPVFILFICSTFVLLIQFRIEKVIKASLNR